MTNTDQRGFPDPKVKPTMTVLEAARWLDVSKASAYEAVHRGQLPALRVGRRLLVPTAALLRLLQIEPETGEPAA